MYCIRSLHRHLRWVYCLSVIKALDDSCAHPVAVPARVTIFDVIYKHVLNVPPMNAEDGWTSILISPAILYNMCIFMFSLSRM